MDKPTMTGVLLSSAGAISVAFGGLILSQACTSPGLNILSSGSVCAFPKEISVSVYFLGVIGGALGVIGVRVAGIGRRRMRAEGGGLVVAIGTVVSTLGFSLTNLLPFGSSIPAEIGFSLGVVGSVILVFGVLKLSIQQTTRTKVTTACPTLRNPHWSAGEWVVVGLLISVLLVPSLFLAMALTQQSPHNWCGAYSPTPCPGREALNFESQTLNSPTNMTIGIRNTGSAAISLIAYYVKDGSGHHYDSTNWSGPTIPTNAVTPINVITDGTLFTFQTGNYYAVTVITARNNQFTFTVLA